MNAFFELIQVAIGARDRLSAVPGNREEWEELFKVVGQHNLLPLTFPVIDTLHDEVDVPLGVYSRWAMVDEKVRRKNESLSPMTDSVHAYSRGRRLLRCTRVRNCAIAET